MKKLVLIPDSFKGTMSSIEICDIMEQVIRGHFKEAEVVSVPVADGGEGSVDCFLHALGGERVEKKVKGPFFEEVEAFYGLVDGGKTAVVEMAAAAGLPLVGNRRDVRATTTYGVGELMLDAAGRGAGKIVVGLGGSATNDGGCGMAAAAGVRFFRGDGKAFIPTGGSLGEVADIDLSGLDERLRGVDIVAMCDIDNPLTGPQGAAAIFGPQKGADPETVKELDKGLLHLSEVYEKVSGRQLRQQPGAGAAGGMGFGMMAFFNAPLQMGIETVLDTVRFDELVSGADLVLTGEGKIDSQSLRGKVVIGVARRAKEKGVPVAAIVGDIGDGIEPVYGEGVTGVFSINRVAVEYRWAKTRSRDDLRLTVDNLLRFCRGMSIG